jgi:hypothetical protein
MAELASCTLEREAFDSLFEALERRGYGVIGPRVRDGAIVYDRIAASSDLPVGLTDEQDGGHYRLVPREDAALFGYNVGPHSWKRFQLPAQRTLWRGKLDEDGNLSDIVEGPAEPERLAFLGARSCELHAMGILDRVLLGGSHPDPAERAAREGVFIVAVQCSQAGGTCFCASMGTGPTAQSGFDIALTEVIEDGRHYFVTAPGFRPARRAPRRRALRAPPTLARLRKWAASSTSPTSASCSTATTTIRGGTRSPSAA